MAKKDRRRPAVPRKAAQEVIVNTGRTISEWARLMDHCGRRGVKPELNVSWLKKNFGLPHSTALAIQQGYSSASKARGG